MAISTAPRVTLNYPVCRMHNRRTPLVDTRIWVVSGLFDAGIGG